MDGTKGGALGSPAGSDPSRGAILDAFHALLLGAMGAAEDLAVRLDAMADDPAVAVGAMGRHGLDGAFEAVEGHRPASLRHVQGLVIVVTANVAARHRGTPSGE